MLFKHERKERKPRTMFSEVIVKSWHVQIRVFLNDRERNLISCFCQPRDSVRNLASKVGIPTEESIGRDNGKMKLVREEQLEFSVSNMVKTCEEF